METQKMMKTAGVLNKLFRILQRLMVIAIIAAIIFTTVLTIVNHVNPDAMIGMGYTSIELGPVDLTLDSQYAPDNTGILTVCWIMIALVSINVAALWFTLKYVREILDPMQKGNPFHKNTAGSIRKLAWIELAMGIFSNFVKTVAVYAIVEQWHLMDLAKLDGIQEVSVNASSDLNFILIFFGLLLLSYIFDYGASLQQLSDETL